MKIINLMNKIYCCNCEKEIDTLEQVADQRFKLNKRISKLEKKIKNEDDREQKEEMENELKELTFKQMKYICHSCYFEKGKRIPKSDDELAIESLLWVLLDCEHCNHKNSLREFQFQYHFCEKKLIAICPICNKENNVIIKFEKYNKNLFLI